MGYGLRNTCNVYSICYWLQDFFGWINKHEIYFARSISENAEIVLNTVQNAKDISVFDSTLQEDRRGNKDYLNVKIDFRKKNI